LVDLGFECRAPLGRTVALAVDDAYAAQAGILSVGQEGSELGTGLGDGVTVQVETGLGAQFAPLELTQQTLLQAAAGEKQRLFGIDVGGMFTLDEARVGGGGRVVVAGAWCRACFGVTSDIRRRNRLSSSPVGFFFVIVVFVREVMVEDMDIGGFYLFVQNQ